MSLSFYDLNTIESRTQGAISKTEKNTDRIVTLLQQNLAVSEKILEQMSHPRLTGPDQDVFQRTQP